MELTTIFNDLSQHLLENIDLYYAAFVGWGYIATIQAWFAPGLEARGWPRLKGLSWIWMEFKWSLYYFPYVVLSVAGLYFSGIISKLLLFQLCNYFAQFFFICYILPLPVYGAQGKFMVPEKIVTGVSMSLLLHAGAYFARAYELQLAGKA